MRIWKRPFRPSRTPGCLTKAAMRRAIGKPTFPIISPGTLIPGHSCAMPIQLVRPRSKKPGTSPGFLLFPMSVKLNGYSSSFNFWLINESSLEDSLAFIRRKTTRKFSIWRDNISGLGNSLKSNGPLKPFEALIEFVFILGIFLKLPRYCTQLNSTKEL